MNIIQTLLGLLNTPQLLEKLSGLLGESGATTQKGLAAAVPAILGGLISKGSTESGAGSLIDLMKTNKIDGGILDNLGSLFGGQATGAQTDAGSSMLKGILGGKADAVSQLVGSVSGMSSGNASTLMALAAPAVLGGVAKAAPAGGFTASGLMDLLMSQKDHLAKVAPAGLGSLLGLGGLSAAASSIAGAASSAMGSGSAAAGAAMQSVGAGAAAMTESGGMRAMLPWLIGAVLLGLALLFGVRTCATSRTEQPVAEAPVAPVAEPAAPAAPEPVPAEPPTAGEIKLPRGATLTVPPGSVGESLFKFLTGSETGSKTFLFDGLKFETGRATLDPSSQATITAIAAILKEFTTVTASVDGHTDNVGSRGGNLRLSQRRAQAVMSALTAAGVDAARVKAVGHGDGKPIADNGTEEGRSQNRRTELTATKN